MPGAAVDVYGAGPSHLGSGVTDSAGVFSALIDPFAGPFRFEVAADGYRPLAWDNPSLPAPAPVVYLDKDSVTVSCSVRSRHRGSPVRGATAYIEPHSKGVPVRHDTVDDTGIAGLSDVDWSRSWDVRAEAAGYDPARVHLVCPATAVAGRIQAAIQLDPVQDVDFLVTNRRSKASVAGALITLSSAQSGVRHVATAGGAGRVRSVRAD